jgi:hypothetical protein
MDTIENLVYDGVAATAKPNKINRNYCRATDISQMLIRLKTPSQLC